MGPRTAAEQYLKRHPGAKRFQVTLYGSLAATGKGHLTDWAIYNVLGKDRTEFIWHPEIVLPFHPNGMKYEAFSSLTARAYENTNPRVRQRATAR